MKTILLVAVVLSTLISTLVLYYLARRWVLAGRMEGFEGELPEKEGSDETEDTNVLLSLVSQLKRMGGFLTTASNWTERIQMTNMSPMELARRHIKSNAKAE